MATKLEELQKQGQAPWIDFITRSILRSGGMQELIDKGIVGVTSNPTIFEKAISGGTDYDEPIRDLVRNGASPEEIYDHLIVDDIRETTDLFRPIYDRTDGGDGYVSLEVAPGLAYDTEASIEEARKYHSLVDRPNLFIKIPATDSGIPAIRQLLSEGLNINITLIFSIDYYEQVMDAYIEALEQRAAAGQPIDTIASVASFFVSRVDTEVDKRLDKMIEQETDNSRKQRLESLKGKAAIANARIAYEHFQKKFSGERWKALQAKGAKVQRPLWASTSTKNPNYPDVMYVNELIGPDTVDTMPPATIDAFIDHGVVARTLDTKLDEAHKTIDELEEVGISLKDVTDKLQSDGVKIFADSFKSLDNVIRDKHDALLQDASERQEATLGKAEAEIQSKLESCKESSFSERLWKHDASLWKQDSATQEKIRNRLGWLDVIDEMRAEASNLESFGKEIKDAGYTHAVLLGMGGSSLAPDVLQNTFGSVPGYPKLIVLDTTDTDTISTVVNEIDAEKTLFIVSSKSGGTLETQSLYRFFWQEVSKVKSGNEGENFIAITDPGTVLGEEAKEKGFRRLFENRPDIGGRYSALSYFGLVPAAIIGLSVTKLVEAAQEMAKSCGPERYGKDNPGLWLGAIMGGVALAGRNKLTLVLPPSIGTFGYWVEQLIAESTGKEGTGILPVEGEVLGAPSDYGDDRLFVHISIGSPEDSELSQKLQSLADAGHPVVSLRATGPLGLGGEFLRWETATAVAGAVLGINPFDEPNVQESKDNTSRLLKEYEQTGKLPEDSPEAMDGNLALYGVKADSLQDAITSFVSAIKPGDYLAIMAYLQRTKETEKALQDARTTARNAFKVATTLGYGPRFLHSTGQLHKGGSENGVFVQITSDEKGDLDIPGADYSFNTLKHAQALGDFQALKGRGRRAIKVHIKGDLAQGLKTVGALMKEATAVTG